MEIAGRHRPVPSRVGVTSGHADFRLIHDLDPAVVITVVAVGVVQVAVDEVIHVVTVRHRLVAAARPMTMGGLVPVAEAGGAVRRVLAVDLEAVLVDMVAMGMMQTAVVQIVGVAVVLHCRVAAVRTMLVGVIFVYPMLSHNEPPAE
jgi:hypothetical protein